MHHKNTKRAHRPTHGRQHNTLQNQILRGHPLLFFPFPALSRDYVAIIAGVQRIDGPLQVKCWGCPDPCGLDALHAHTLLTAEGNRVVTFRKWLFLD